ncbi:hypothetical protein [uncultured Gimesia sp.]|uniref:hypothetical protein n=1 Tax=uncultured Gimesia sp. TaxID=1678688 RepID=UPI002602125A|nr:hypothetical protein [uncultured Gimesia sp.]
MFRKFDAFLLKSLNLASWFVLAVETSEESAARHQEAQRLRSQASSFGNDGIRNDLEYKAGQLEAGPDRIMRLFVVLLLLMAPIAISVTLLGSLLDSMGVSPKWFFRVLATGSFMTFAYFSYRYFKSEQRRAIEAGYEGFFAHRHCQPEPIFTPFSVIFLSVYMVLFLLISWGTVTRKVSTESFIILSFGAAFLNSAILSLPVLFISRFVEGSYCDKIRRKHGLDQAELD